MPVPEPIRGAVGPSRPAGEGLPSVPPEVSGPRLADRVASGLLKVIVDLARTLVAGVDAASVSPAVGGDGALVETKAASSEVARRVDEGQYQGDAGPGVEAIRTGAEVTVSLPDGRWPIFAAAATREGVPSLLSVPLTSGGETTGSLNLYSMSVEALEPARAGLCRRLANDASMVVVASAALTTIEVTNDQLHQALISRDVIGQAKGILMARQGLDANAAFGVLRRGSQPADRKLRDVAAGVVATIQDQARP